LRAAWHDARTALTRADAHSIHHLTDGEVLSLPAEAAPPSPPAGDMPHRNNTAARDAGLAALRARAQAAAARRRGDHDQAARQEALAESYHAMRDAYSNRGRELETARYAQQENKRETARQPPLAGSAGAELGWRHPSRPWLPLPGEPGPHRDHATNSERKSDTPEIDLADTARRVRELAARHRKLSAKLTELADRDAPRTAFPLEPPRPRSAILQPPKPEIPPSPWILAQAAARDLEPEATD
jgi:hypothetical protein